MLATLYGVFGLYIIISEILRYLKSKKIDYFTLFGIYFFAYYIIPSFVYNFTPDYVSRYSHAMSYGRGTYTALILIILAFFSVKLGYKYILKRKSSNLYNSDSVKKSREIKNEELFFNVLIRGLWIVGGVSFLIHCYMYGGIVSAITNSALVRDGKVENVSGDGIGFVSRFVICLMYSSYFVFMKFLKNKTTLLNLAFSISCALLYLIIHAGRGAILTYIITLFFIYIAVNGKNIKFKNWIILFIIVVVGVSYIRPLLASLTSLTEGFDAFWSAFMRRVNDNSGDSTSGSIISNLLYKLCYNLEHKYVSLEVAIRVIKNGKYEYNFFRDVWIAAVSVVPASMLPFSKPHSIGYYNTALINGYNSTTGTIPPGGVAFAYYAFGVIGVILFSIIIGVIGRKIVNYLESFNSKNFEGIKIINMFVWVDFFINGELKESVIRYFVFLVILIITFLCSKKVEKKNEKNVHKIN